MLQQHSQTQVTALTPRLRKPTVKDPRLIVGILLVAVSVLIGVWAVNSAKDLTTVFVARETIAQGQAVTQSELRPIEVNLGSQTDAYFTKPLDSNVAYYAQETIRGGEFISIHSLGNQAQQDQRVVSITTSTPLPAEVGVGTKLDLWVITKTGDATGGTAPRLVAEGLVVNELPNTDGALSTSRNQSVHVIVDEPELADVLAVTSSEYTLALLPQVGDLS